MFEITHSDYDEKENKAYAEIMLELNIAYHLVQDLKAHSGFWDGLKKDAKFHNFDVEIHDDFVRIFFQIEQDVS